MNFEHEFEDWLNKGLENNIPASVKAFSFNLFEPASIDNVKFGIELIGADIFDPNNSDWACEEIWEPNERRLNIPTTYSGEDWESCLKVMKDLVLKEIKSGSFKKLKSKEGIGIGFVDGDLEVIWQS